MKNLKIFSWIAVAGLAVCMIVAIILFAHGWYAPFFVYTGKFFMFEQFASEYAYIYAEEVPILFMIAQYIAALIFFIIVACASTRTRVIGLLGIASSALFLYPLLMRFGIVQICHYEISQPYFGYWFYVDTFYNHCGKILFLATCFATVIKFAESKLVKIAVGTLVGGWALLVLPETCAIFDAAYIDSFDECAYIIFIYPALAFFIIALTKGADSQPALAASAPVPPQAPAPVPVATPTAVTSEVTLMETVEERAEGPAQENGKETGRGMIKAAVAGEPVPSKAEIEQMKAELEQLKSKLNSL